MINNLPKNWCSATIEEIAIRITDGTHQTPNYANAGIRFISTTNIKPFSPGFDFSEYSRYIAQEDHNELTKRCSPVKGDILVSKCGTIGRVKQIDVDYPFSIFVGLALIKPHEGIFLERFLEYLLNSPPIQKAFLKAAPGSTRKTLTLGSIKPIEIPIPPLREQKRIIGKIEELFTDLDAGVEALKKSKTLIKQYRQSILKAAFDGKLTESWRNKNNAKLELPSVLAEKIKDIRANGSKRKAKELTPIDTADLLSLPDSWCWTQLYILGVLNRGKSKHRPRDDARLFGGKYPFIQTGDVKKAEGLLVNYTQTYSDFGLSQSKLWPPGTLCITIAANIADTAVLGMDACFPDSVVGFTCNTEISSTQYVHYFLRSIKDRIEQFAPATAQKNINLEILENLFIPVTNIAEQKIIVEEIEKNFSIADSAEKIVDSGLKQAERLRQSILNKAFEGRLVSQTSEDESVQSLLDRIKAQKAKAEPSKDRISQKKVSK